MPASAAVLRYNPVGSVFSKKLSIALSATSGDGDILLTSLTAWWKEWPAEMDAAVGGTGIRVHPSAAPESLKGEAGEGGGPGESCLGRVTRCES